MKTISAVIVAVIFFGMMIIALGCGGADSQAEKEAIEAVLTDNLKALQEKDLDGYLATLDEESPGYEKMKQIVPRIFEIYDLQHELEDIKVIDIYGREAKVRTVQTARRLAGPDSYRHNRSITVHTLRNHDSGWKLYDTRQESVEYLD